MNITGAKIEGSLNLSFSEVNIPLRFSQCYFTQALRLQQTKLRRLDLSGTHIFASEISSVPGEEATPTCIDAREINVIGSVFLNQGFKAVGRVSLIGATIGCDFNCGKGTFSNKTGDALLASEICHAKRRL
ncbi:hypothetical protein K9N68_12400 [Kovacikia minuta CCNUW1]|uniref:hypothetical protein n=1 Tax=Kovacikia minuta TaxID=2931930 RepID=UPI001CCA902E|nr:hypothetical protein [Kovacikia minuta]UBF28601.1 hypothetical protein K9N68_12400 [Kovacikia minuta CCNUW1]